MDAAAIECAIGYDAAVGCVTMTWRGRAAGAPFREANEAVLHEIRKRGARRLLGDIERLETIAPADQRWLGQDWIPRTIAAGLRSVALVTPAFELGHAPVRLVGEALPPGLELEYFDDLEAARGWLRGR